MSDSAYHVHTVSKHNTQEQAVFSISASTLPPVPESTVRLRVDVLALTANNYTYALGGHRLFWWDAYPVPLNAPEPYNGRQDWGIVPAWGFAEITESTIPELPPKTTLWGFWPVSSLPVDLRLQPAGVNGHWTETSDHRIRLMNIYNRYETVVPGLTDVQRAQTSLLKPLFSTGYLLNRHVFPSNPEDTSTRFYHPFGAGQPWSKEEADLTSAVVISLAASSKTGLGYSQQILQNRETTKGGPLAFIQVASQTARIFSPKSSGEMVTQNVTYDDITSDKTIDWIVNLEPSRIICVDFGAPPALIEKIKKTLETSQALSKDIKLMFIMVGTKAEARPSLMADRQAEDIRTMSPIQFNTSTLRDDIMEAEGEKKYFEDVNSSFEKYLSDVSTSLPSLQPSSGFSSDAITKTWEQLCHGKQGEHVVFKL